MSTIIKIRKQSFNWKFAFDVLNECKFGDDYIPQIS